MNIITVLPGSCVGVVFALMGDGVLALAVLICLLGFEFSDTRPAALPVVKSAALPDSAFCGCSFRHRNHAGFFGRGDVERLTGSPYFYPGLAVRLHDMGGVAQ